jgi:osmotically-inducible protein OsmY
LAPACKHYEQISGRNGRNHASLASLFLVNETEAKMAGKDWRNEDRFHREDDWRRRSRDRSESSGGDRYGRSSAREYGRNDRDYRSNYGQGREGWSSGDEFSRSRDYGSSGDWVSGSGATSRRHGQRDESYGYDRSRNEDRFGSDRSYGRDYGGGSGGNRGYGGDYGRDRGWSLDRDSGVRGDWGYTRGSSSEQDYGRGYGGEERSFWDRASDEVSSWFGDEEAARRRQQDQRGRGPRNYTRSGDRIREDVNDRLTDDWRVDASDIEVTVSGTEVTLTGTVSTREQRRRAEDITENISGVTHVQNNLRVKQLEKSWSGAGIGSSQRADNLSSSTGSAGSVGSAASATGTTTTNKL